MNLPNHAQVVEIINAWLLGFSCAIALNVPKWFRYLTYFVCATVSMMLARYWLKH